MAATSRNPKTGKDGADESPDIEIILHALRNTVSELEHISFTDKVFPAKPPDIAGIYLCDFPVSVIRLMPMVLLHDSQCTVIRKLLVLPHKAVGPDIVTIQRLSDITIPVPSKNKTYAHVPVFPCSKPRVIQPGVD